MPGEHYEVSQKAYRHRSRAVYRRRRAGETAGANLGLALAIAALAGTLSEEGEPAKIQTLREDEKRRRDQDAIAAPYREARRLRNLKKLQQGQTS